MILLLHAPNIHRGGGGTLLVSLVEAFPDGLSVHLIADKRFALSHELQRRVRLTWVEPTLAGRIGAERRLRELSNPDSVVLCLGNLPPLFELRSKVFLFLQNRLLCDPVTLSGYPLRARMRILVERNWLRKRLHNVHHVIVQTPSMRDSVRRNLRVESRVMPFAPSVARYKRSKGAETVPLDPTKTSIAYVSSGDAHKNHERLIEAWRHLAAECIRPALHLTLDPSTAPEILLRIEAARRETGAVIVNHGAMDRARVLDLYERTDALIYPSQIESLGLPLIEARVAGIAILASERDYVRDAIDPEQTFDPLSALSIARAVKRFLGIPERALPILSAEEFLREILEL